MILKRIGAWGLSVLIALGLIQGQTEAMVPTKNQDAEVIRVFSVEEEVPVGTLFGELLKGREYNHIGDYNAMYARPQDLKAFGGVDLFKGRKLANMTIAEVIEAQGYLNAPSVRWAKSKGYRRVPYSTAVGKYQVVKSTLRWAVDQLNIPVTTKFSEPVQDVIGEFLLMEKRRPIRAFVDGDSDDIESALVELGNEWEAFDYGKYPDKERRRDAEKFLRTLRTRRVRARRGFGYV